jgi:hypothetical protein
VRPYFKGLKERCPEVRKPQVGWIRKLRLLFWERILYLSEAIMSKTGSFDFRSFWTDKPMSSGTTESE